MLRSKVLENPIEYACDINCSGISHKIMSGVRDQDVKLIPGWTLDIQHSNVQ